MAERSIVKHSYIRAGKSALGRAKAHLRYIRFRPGREGKEDDRQFFNSERDDISFGEVAEVLASQPPNGVLMHKVILSPGLAEDQVVEAATEVMESLCQSKGMDLQWYGVKHTNTDNAHVHIVVMGRAEDGRAVKITKRDHSDMREVGDKYREKHGGRKQSKLKEQLEKLQDSVSILLNLSSEQPFAPKVPSGKPPAGRLGGRSGPIDETARLGEKPTKELLEAKELRRKERERRIGEKKWKEYCKPMQVDYARGTDLEGVAPKFTVDRSASLSVLKGLLADYEKGEAAVRASLSREDAQRLSKWIKEKEVHEKKLAMEARNIDEIKATLYGERDASWTQASTRESLEELKWLDEKGIVVLSEAEKQALSKWSLSKDPKYRRMKSGWSGMKGEYPQKRPRKVEKRRYSFLPNAFDRGEQFKVKREYLEKSREVSARESAYLTSADVYQQDDSVYKEVYGAGTSAMAAGPMGATLGGNRSLGPARSTSTAQGAMMALKGKIAAQGMAMREQPQPEVKAQKAGAVKVEQKAPQPVKQAPAKVESQAKPQGQQKGQAQEVKPVAQKSDGVPSQQKQQEAAQRKIEEEQLREKRKRKKDKGDPNRDPEDADEWTR